MLKYLIYLLLFCICRWCYLNKCKNNIYDAWSNMKFIISLKMLSNCVVWKKKLFLQFEPCTDVSFTLAEQFNDYYILGVASSKSFASMLSVTLPGPFMTTFVNFNIWICKLKYLTYTLSYQLTFCFLIRWISHCPYTINMLVKNSPVTS